MEGQERVEKSKTVMSADVEIVGSIKCQSNIQIEGKLKGDLNCGSKVTIGEKASIMGNLNVKSITISGKVNGNISASDRIELKSTANVSGDIKAKRLMIEDGVSFIGKSEVNASAAQVSSSEKSSKKNEDSSESKDDDDKVGGLFGRK